MHHSVASSFLKNRCRSPSPAAVCWRRRLYRRHAVGSTTSTPKTFVCSRGASLCASMSLGTWGGWTCGRGGEKRRREKLISPRELGVLALWGNGTSSLHLPLCSSDLTMPVVGRGICQVQYCPPRCYPRQISKLLKPRKTRRLGGRGRTKLVLNTAAVHHDGPNSPDSMP